MRYRVDGLDEDWEEEAPAGPEAILELSGDLIERYREGMTDWFRLLNRQAADAGVRLIIYYHPQMALNMDGGMTFYTHPQCLPAFARACADAGVIFIDMTGEFRRAYEQDHIVAKGFANTALATGHLNSQGQRLVAEAIYRAIRQAEGETT